MSEREIIVRVADLQVGGPDTVLATLGLGSCVAIMLYDAQARVGGMAHVLLPAETLSRQADNPAKFPQTAVPALLAGLAPLGGNPRRLTARLVGGATMFAALAAPGTIHMGERNVVAARQVLSNHAIPIVGEAVGGDFGRSVHFRLADGKVRVSSVMHGEHDL